MKKIIQLTLFLLLVVISIVFYQNYLRQDNNPKLLSKFSQSELSNIDNENKMSNETSNIIKNLKYEVIFDDKKNYIIESKLNEISYVNDDEIVSMIGVFAVFSDEDEIPLIITSDKAKYNNTNYNTNFYENVKITYLNHQINSDKLDLNFKENVVRIYDNVVYDGSHGSILTENVSIDLITRDVQIYMNDNDKKVEVSSKE